MDVRWGWALINSSQRAVKQHSASRLIYFASHSANEAALQHLFQSMAWEGQQVHLENARAKILKFIST